ncbi:MAG: hypothetical protein JRF39_14265 [Deltaproteobacteria bacterium]|jgi:hypothetical protein|nr:hypothetical protein [Deltaproteobacteria bacterium]
MSIQPTGEDLRKAVKWISDKRKYNPEKELKTVIEEACVKFDLSPLDEDFLLRKLFEQEK